MPPARLPPAALAWSRSEEVEAQFYDALRSGDLERLMACFIDDERACCIHPGGMRLDGIAAIQAGFEALFAQGMAEIHAHEVVAWSSEGMAVHQVVERIGPPGSDSREARWVQATNVYTLTDRGWRMVCHHASASASGHDAPARAAFGGGGPPGTLH